MFLSRFPKRWYTIGEDQVLLTNICKSVALSKEALSNDMLFLPYVIREGERPDNISQRLYGDPKYWWLICLANNIHNIDTQWPKSQRDLEEYTIDKYGNPGDIIYYMDDDFDEVDVRAWRLELGLADDTSVVERMNLTDVTGWEHEEMVNDAKRNIRLIDPDVIDQFDQYLEVALDE